MRARLATNPREETTMGVRITGKWTRGTAAALALAATAASAEEVSQGEMAAAIRSLCDVAMKLFLGNS